MNKKRMIKNIVVICLGVFTLFMACDGLAKLQSTMNYERNIGVICQAIIYGCLCFSALLFPKYVINKYGSKVTFVISMLSYIPYIAVNYYPHWIVMIPASVLIGLGASLLWGSQATYLNDISVMYAELSLTDKSSSKSNINCISSKQDNSDTLTPDIARELNYSQVNDGYDGPQSFYLNNDYTVSNSSAEQTGDLKTKKGNNVDKDTTSIIEKHGQSNEVSETLQTVTEEKKKQKIESITARVFGIHGMSFLSCHIWSNLMIYFIFRSEMDAEINLSNHSNTCGALYCNAHSNFSDNSNEGVSDKTRYILTTICFSLSIIAVLIVGFFLDPLETKSEKHSSSLNFLFATTELLKRKEVLLLIPASLYVGQMQGFFAGEFTKAFISCSWGTYNVSLVSVGYGFFCVLSSTSSGWMIKFFGRIFTFTLVALLNLAALILLLMWIPDPSHPEMYFIVSGMMGICNGFAWSQLRAFYGVLFRTDENAAFAAFHLWYSLGFCISFAYSGYFCTYIKLYILIVVSSLGYVGYIIVEKIAKIKSTK